MNEVISINKLARITTDGGDVMHGLKAIENSYKGFGEIYFSWISKNLIKGWKRHTKMTMNLIVPYGSVRFVFFESNTQRYLEEIIGVENYVRITVPPGIWFAFQGLSLTKSLVVNIANIVHDQKEVEKKPLDYFNFNWRKS